MLDSFLFSDDTNLLYTYKKARDLFYAIHLELEKIIQWFKTNIFSINIKKTKFTLFHKNYFKDQIPLK